jgi:hypothetical protein
MVLAKANHDDAILLAENGLRETAAENKGRAAEEKVSVRCSALDCCTTQVACEWTNWSGATLRHGSGRGRLSCLLPLSAVIGSESLQRACNLQSQLETDQRNAGVRFALFLVVLLARSSAG